MVSIEAVWLACGLFFAVLGLGLALAPHGARLTVAALTVAGLLAAMGKIWLFQQAPQWQDINPDSITYDLNAKAFALHWQGVPVSADAFNLRGLKAFHAAGAHTGVWLPDDWMTYGWIVGSGDWLYTAYVGLWYLAGATHQMAIWSNALLAAFLPAAAFGIALALGATRKVALAAGVLAVLDPSSGVNASWLLKDTLVGFLSLAALWAILRMWQERRWPVLSLLVFILALALLGVTRYVAFLVLYLAAVAVLVFWFKTLRPWPVVMALALAWLGQGVLTYMPQTATAPQTVTALQTATAPLSGIQGGLNVLKAKRGEAGADDTTLRWKEYLSHNPIAALLVSGARTLFSP